MYLGGNRRWVLLIDRDSCCIMKSNKTEKNCLKYFFLFFFISCRYRNKRKKMNQACFRVVPLISVLLGLLVVAVKGSSGYGRYEIKGEDMAMQICMSLFQLVIGTGLACFFLPPFPLKKMHEVQFSRGFH